MYVAASAAEGLSRWGVYRELPMAAAPMAKTTSFYRRNPPLDRVSLVRAKPSFSCFCALAGDDVFSVTSATQFDVDYLGQSTKGDLNVKSDHLDSFGLGGRSALEGPIEEVARAEAGEAEDLLRHLGIPVLSYSSRKSICSILQPQLNYYHHL
ncbi:hypothetical protein CK203_078770 [Vitis vinifera]|uniref:Uncharacterized protein n=1 Tax=Vitis vinifera TaxID=29760 RepID=A0A438F7I7_VITVI|nr:hypothetical protein CK203_078770 [Vitis vinifera]